MGKDQLQPLLYRIRNSTYAQNNAELTSNTWGSCTLLFPYLPEECMLTDGHIALKQTHEMIFLHSSEYMQGEDLLLLQNPQNTVPYATLSQQTSKRGIHLPRVKGQGSCSARAQEGLSTPLPALRRSWLQHRYYRHGYVSIISMVAVESA